MQVLPWGETHEGSVKLYTLKAEGIEAEIMNYGGIVRALRVPDRQGRLGDVVLGYDTLDAYLSNPCYLGALVGRCANRILGGTFELDGLRYELARNAGACHLHGGLRGFNHRLWTAEPFRQADSEGLRLTLHSPDGEEGYPGNLEVTVTYRVKPDVLAIAYEARTDASTIVNLTHHSYFNLASGGDIHGHRLRIEADAYTPMTPDFVPSGELAPVQGTPLDFHAFEAIGRRIQDDHEQLRLAGGYDHNYVLRHAGSGLMPAAQVHEPGLGRTLSVWTTEPGVQFYAGNFIADEVPGKGGIPLRPRTGFCLETQRFPDAPHNPHFPSIVLRPGETLRSRTEYRFGVR